MPWFSGGKRLVKRTCLDCGESWTLGADLAHARAGRGWLGGPGLRPGFGQGGLAAAEQEAAAAEAELEQEQETVRQARTCPKCGSQLYKDQRI